jgi:2-keto-4-pentenoate hydratase/2-oxohepta-3-ene-1,7-dioic acid hydratase in catechol pathway
MKLVSFRKDGKDRWGAVIDGGIVDMSQRRGGKYPTLKSALAARALDAICCELQGITADFPLASATLIPPIPDPDKVICIGLNYRAHVGEGGGKIPEFPSLFTRFADTLVGDGEAILLPRVSSELDYECELALVIGEPCRHISRSEAMRSVRRSVAAHAPLGRAIGSSLNEKRTVWVLTEGGRSCRKESHRS